MLLLIVGNMVGRGMMDSMVDWSMVNNSMVDWSMVNNSMVGLGMMNERF